MDRRLKSRRKTNRNRLLFESLENRRVLAAATNLASILGVVFDDFTGNGQDAGEEVSGATLNLYADDGDGIFEPGSGDTLQTTDTTDGSGNYRFDNLTAGGYWVQQPAQSPGGTTLVAAVSPLINISATDVQGTLISTIDSFDTTTQSVTDITNDGSAVTSSVAAGEAIGGERDFLVNRTSAAGSVSLDANSLANPDELIFGAAGGGQGQRTLSYDGADGTASTIDDTGLASTDLTASGTATGLDFSIGADLAGGILTVRVYSDDGNAGTRNRFSIASVSIPATVGSTTEKDYIPFTSFADGGAGGGAANFSQVGAVEFEISGAADVDGSIEGITTVGPTLFTQSFSNFESADLSVTKIVSNSTPNVGDNVTYTLTVSNGGPDGATNVALVDNLPAGMTFVSSTPSQGSYNSGTGIWTVGSLSSGSNATLQIVATVSTGGTKTNTTQVSASDQFDGDSTPGNSNVAEDDLASVALTPAVADLSLTKGVNDSTPDVGDNVTFTVTVSNAGPASATNVQVTDALPAGLSFVSATPTQGSFNSGTGVWTVGTIASGSNATISLVAQVTTTGVKTNTAQVTASDQTDTDSTPNNNNASEDDQASVTVTPSVIDLSLLKTVNDATPDLNDTIAYTLTLNNAGPNNATNVQVADLLPGTLTFVSAIASQGSYNNLTGVWTVGGVNSSGSATLQINATVNSTGTITNTAQVSAADQSDVDSTPNNGNASEDDQASVSIATQQVDLSLAKTVSNSTPNVGDSITFTIVASNAGPDAATNVAVTDVLPAGLTFTGSSQTQGGYTQGTGIWTVGTIGSGGSATLNITATVGSTATITNTAQISAQDQSDVDSTPNNSNAAEDDQDSVTVTPQQADLSITKTVNDSNPNVGENVTFTVTVSNSGPSTASNVSVSEAFPGGMSFVSSTASQGSYDSLTQVWTVGSIASGSSATLNITATVNNAAAQTNSAEVRTSDQVDPDSTPNNGSVSEDDFASVTLMAPSADLSLNKTVSNSTPNVGDNVTYTVTLNNAGTDAATGVTVLDQLPAGVTFVSSTPSQGSYNSSTGVWTVGSVGNGAGASLQIVATVDSTGLKTNTAQVSAADQVDPDSTPGNSNAAEDDQNSVSITPQIADLSLLKSVNNATPNVGENVSFTVTVANDGPNDATNVQVSDVLPTGLTFVSSTPNQGAYNSATGNWTIGSIASGGSATLVVVATVTTTSPITNTAQISAADQFDSDSTPNNSAAAEDDQDEVTLSPTSADLSLSKTVNNSTPNVGDNVTFTITVTNAGPSGATGVSVLDTLPTGITFVSATPSVGSFNSGSGVWTVGSIGSGGNATLQLVATVNTSGDKTNTAQVSASDQADVDSTPGNGVSTEDDQDSVTISPQLIDLSLAKTIDNASPNVGDAVTFTITASNAGPGDATGVQVTDVLPVGMTFTGSQASRGAYDSGTGIWTIGNISTGESVTLDISATVNVTGVKTNAAEVTAADQPDSDSIPNNGASAEDDEASVSLTPTIADLSLLKSVSDATPNVNDTVTFTITVSNAGPDSATNVAVEDVLPAGTEFVSFTSSQGTYNSATGLWTVGTIPSAGSETLSLVARVLTSGAKINSAQVSAADQTDPDSTPGNSAASEDDQSEVSITPQIADLSVSKTVDDATPAANQDVTFTVLVNNAGPDTATGVVIRDVLPVGMTFVSTTPSIGSYNNLTGLWTVGSVDSGASASLQVVATVDSAGSKTNVAEVQAVDQFDPDSTADNSVTTEDDYSAVTVIPEAVDLSITKTIDSQTPDVGDTVNLLVTLNNAGPNDATGVEVVDTLPAGMTLVSVTPSQGTFDTATGLWTVGSVANGASASLQLAATVTQLGIKTASAEVTATDQFDTDSTPANAVATEDDQAEVLVRSPRTLSKRLFMSR